MKAIELKKKFLEFFQEKGHKIIPNVSLIPEEDPSVLFTSAGMQPLVPYFLGGKHPQGQRLVNIQRCLRTDDIEEIGDTAHLTFFEMLGNWSLGDYWKEEAIKMSWEFLTNKKWLGIDPDRIYISVFKGDETAPRDEESAKIWQDLGIPQERIYYFGKEVNWWEPTGETGPCGPDTEMFVDSGKEPCGLQCNPSCQCGKYIEVWNDVFIQYNKIAPNKYESIRQKNVDTGMGLERMAMVLQNVGSVFETDLFRPIIEAIKKLSNPPAGGDEQKKSLRIIADHLRAATFILGDEKGIVPSNLDRGYVVRRLIRRAIRHGKKLDIKENFSDKITQAVIKNYEGEYPILRKNQKKVLEELRKEEERFQKTLKKGLKEFEKLTSDIKWAMVDGRAAFDLFATYGFPIEITKELAQERGLKVDEEGFQKEFQKHQEISRKGAEQKFKGGLADHSEEVVKYHTATHLLHQALREVLGPHVQQKGSNITSERLRFDFINLNKLTDEEIKKVEEIVNQKIQEDLKVKSEEMTMEEAKKVGAIGLFEQKYQDKVKVYFIGDFSKEICGGPHVEHTGVLGKFKILSEKSSSAGVRRIKAVLE